MSKTSSPKQIAAGIKPRTLRLHVGTYNHILEFCQRSASGITANELIRQLLFHFGQWCQARLEAGRVLTEADLEGLPDWIEKATKDPKDPNTDSTNA